MDVLNILGLGTALAGLVAVACAGAACREAMAMPRIARDMIDWPLLGALVFVLTLNLLIIAAGTWLALMDITFGGGAHG